MTIKKRLVAKICLSILMAFCLMLSATAQAFAATSDWLGYADSGNGSSYVTRNTPTSYAQLNWSFDYSTYVVNEYANASEPVLYGSNVVIAVDDTLLQIDKTSGYVSSEMTLAGIVGYTTRTLINGNKIIVPLDGGITECVNLDTMTSLWTTSTIGSATQSACTLRAIGNFVYVATCDINYATSTYNNGHFQKININTGAIVWDYINATEGYYWTGPAIVDDKVINVTSQGTVQVFSDSTGSILSTLSLGVITTSDCIYNSSKNEIYVVTSDGNLNVLTLATTGAITLSSTAQTGLKATQNTGLSNAVSTPVIAGNNLIIGGQTATSSALSIVNLNNYSNTIISTADGAALSSGGIKGSPLVSTVGADTYVYFTVNNADTVDYVTYAGGGGIYMYKLGDTQATELYDAAGFNQYCDSPVIADAAGNLFYINDSGNLFGVSATTTPIVIPPGATVPQTVEEVPTWTDDYYPYYSPTSSSSLASTGDTTVCMFFGLLTIVMVATSLVVIAYRK